MVSIFRMQFFQLTIALFSLSAIPAQLTGQGGGLVIVGGGRLPEAAELEFIELCGGNEAKIAILPQASQLKERGQSSRKRFLELGVKDCWIADLTDPLAARERLKSATGIWMPGGSQSRLVDALEAAGITAFLRKLHRQGVVIGGTSAGAAAMSESMIVRSPKNADLTKGNTPTGEGMGLLADVIVDQHFTERKRVSRLLSVVLDHPEKLGVGIDESTAIIVAENSFKVVGTGNVVVIDARDCSTSSGDQGIRQSATDIKLHILKAGQGFKLRN